MLNDFLQKLRLSSIFGGGQPGPTFDGSFNPQPAATTPPFVPDDGYDAGARMRELFQPESQNIDRFNDLASQYPTYQEPGKLKKIGAVALASLADYARPGSGKGGFDEMMGYAPHNRQVADWKARIEPLETAANYERQANNQNRQFATSTVSAEQKQHKDEATAKTNEEKTRISAMRADVYKFRAENPMARIVSQKGGNTLAINPITGQTIRDFGPSGSMSDAERIDLEQKNKMAAQDDAQAAGMEKQDDAQAAAEALERTRQGNRVALKGTPSASTAAGGKPESATQRRVAQFIKAQEIANTDPELKRFIKLGAPGTNDFEISEPSDGFFGYGAGPTPEQYKKLQTLIYGEAPPEVKKTNVPPPVVPPKTGGRTGGPGPVGGTPKVAPITKTQKNKVTGETRTLVSVDGGKTWSVQK